MWPFFLYFQKPLKRCCAETYDETTEQYCSTLMCGLLVFDCRVFHVWRLYELDIHSLMSDTFNPLQPTTLLSGGKRRGDKLDFCTV